MLLFLVFWSSEFFYLFVPFHMPDPGTCSTIAVAAPGCFYHTVRLSPKSTLYAQLQRKVN
eukprot:3750814-Amphidinium_carterae.1